MTDLWVIGGEQRVGFRQREEWRRYGCALVIGVGDGRLERVLEYQTPPHRHAGEGSHCFKAATLTEDRAYLCTDTEVLICRLPTFAIETVISLPCFNDLHHVAPGPGGTLFVVSTGLDAVAEVTPDGELVRLVDVLGGSVWDRFSPAVDYRRVASTKPHRSHPNHVFFHHGEPWVTRFEQRDVVPLADPGRASRPLAPAGIHDGYAADGQVLLTGVDGRLLCVAPGPSPVLHRDIDFTQADGDPRALGWCRGLALAGQSAWIGFSRLRFTNLRRNVSWVAHGLRAVPPHSLRPTRIARYDLPAVTLETEIDTEPAGLHAIFSIHPAVAAAP